MDFCHTITTTYYNIVIKNPIGNPNYMAYILPFTNLSWISIGLFCIVTPIAVFLTTMYYTIYILECLMALQNVDN